ncbi:PREDICTED: probable glycosyltransferase At5g11130 [Nelumbo nucifera]|uniref:Probable glycosyltransferase At5g11130 n=1 Tax=Nelumbo nucifera TaxID=4432 RepID=A0A1U7ZHN2_NELNU|nr:PREDICTED: probable glycosyltransferase At5g11130 [Nelumbo nucifera]
MARSWFLHYYFSRSGHLSDPFRRLIFIPTWLAFLTSLFIIVYISSTSKLFMHHHHHDHLLLKSSIGSSRISQQSAFDMPPKSVGVSAWTYIHEDRDPPVWNHTTVRQGIEIRQPVESHQSSDSNGNQVKDEVFHGKDIFLQDYKEMNRSFKIYVYPHRKDDPFANALLPVHSEPGGNYASEAYFKKALMKSHFITKDPSEADLFYMPFSIAALRHDKRVNVGGIPDFVKAYIYDISHAYPYWNRSGGADHFYVACHSIGSTATRKAEEVKLKAIQVVCSSSYFLTAYVSHKDASVPQIWPRHGDPPNLSASNRKKLAFFAGAMNSRVRKEVLKTWKDDSEIFVNSGRLKTPYSDALLGSKFCLHLKGFEVNTARIGDAMFYGCVPVIIADYYDLPFTDILDWKSFSLVVPSLDIPLLKRILTGISSDQYSALQRNVIAARQHFKWHPFPVDYDAFHMVMYELWLRRGSIKVPLHG